MASMLSNRWVLWASRLLLGAVFLLAAWPKLIDLPAFATSIKHYRMVPDGLLPLFATGLAGLEAVLGVALVAGLWRKGAAAWATGLTVMFIVALGTAYARGLSIDCGCFTTELSASTAAEKRAHIVERLVQDAGILLVAINLLVQEWRGTYLAPAAAMRPAEA